MVRCGARHLKDDAAMRIKKKEPGVRGARAPFEKRSDQPDQNRYTEDEGGFQQARIIARRFFLSLEHARLIRELMFSSGRRV